MKTQLLTLLVTITLSSTTFAFDEWSNGGCDSGSCGVSVCSECQCTDPNYGRNKCMNNVDYCEAFGNVGGMR